MRFLQNVALIAPRPAVVFRFFCFFGKLPRWAGKSLHSELIFDKINLAMRIGLVSEKSASGDIEHNLSVIERQLSQSKDFDLLLFGESFLQGFNSLSFEYETDAKNALAQNSNVFERIGQAAKESGTATGFGYFETDSTSLYCSYAIIDGSGKQIYNYRRMSTGWKWVEKACDKYK